MSFLTVEDINTINYKYQQFFYWLIDTALISADADYDDAEYDMCRVTKETLSDSYKYTFNISVSKWTKGFYVLDKNGDYQSVSYSFTNNKLVITTAKTDNFKAIKLYIYCGVTAFDNVSLMAYKLINDEINLNYKELNSSQSIEYKTISTNTTSSKSFSLNKGYNLLKYNDSVVIGYLKVNLIKSDFKFDCNQTLTVGKVNTVLLGADDDYKPNGSMIGTNTPSISILYNNSIIPVVWDSTLNDYKFNLDLTDKTLNGNIRFKVIVESNEVINRSETNVILTSDYETVNSFADFVSACSTNGSDIIRVGADLIATSNISVKHSIKIIGNEHTINLDSHSFVLDEDVNFIAEKIVFDSGDPAIKQSKNSKVELTECLFSNCTSTNSNNLGSCILCETSYDSLSVEEDFITSVTGCTFTNNRSCILHGGQLAIANCKFHNTDISVVDKNNPAFIYQVDGDATITNSIFDIDYTSETLCSSEENIGYAQCIFMCGETATINNVTYEQLQNNTVSFLDSPISNRSHVFAKYYYPQVETCVFTSPLSTFEDQAFCYALSGNDWIFKKNVQVTRASWETENTNRKIIWEE